MAAGAARVLRRGGAAAVRVVGVRYASAHNAAAAWEAVAGAEPARAVLMESFHCDTDEEVGPGGVVPYAATLGPKVAARAAEVAGDPAFRARFGGEAVAVLGALRVGAEVRFCDRLHVVSFSRLCARLRPGGIPAFVDELEAHLAAVAETRPRGATDALPQNALCEAVPELWQERHRVMARCAQIAADAGGPVVVVAGEEHVDGIQAMWLDEGEDDLADELMGDPGEHPHGVDEELEVRTFLASLLVKTRTFPPDLVLPDPNDIAEEYKAKVKEMWPRYNDFVHKKLGRHLPRAQSASSQEELMGRIGREPQFGTLSSLAQSLRELQAGVEQQQQQQQAGGA